MGRSTTRKASSGTSTSYSSRSARRRQASSGSDSSDETSSEESSSGEWEACPYQIRTSSLPPLPPLHKHWSLDDDTAREATFNGSEQELKDCANYGDALVEYRLELSLARRYSLDIAPRSTAIRLVRNSVLSRLADAYNLSRGNHTAGDGGQHRAADLFEALIAGISPHTVDNFIDKVFCSAVFPQLAGWMESLRDALATPKTGTRLRRNLRKWAGIFGRPKNSSAAFKKRTRWLWDLHKRNLNLN